GRLPDGVYTHEVMSDGYEEPVRLKATVTVRGDELFVDHAGSSPQSRYGINVVMNYTHAYTSFAVKCAISPEVPHNEGSFRPVHEGRVEQRRVSQRRGRRAGGSHGEPDRAGGRAQGGSAGFRRRGQIPRRLWPVHELCRSQRPDMVDVRHVRPVEVSG